ncbi:carbohydrate ABC transporter permease [uncultured Robinsoniella sp.]|uniref:carbohydrate ABC transporter permease n=1 Tax=uncultured Robinsoniella sp. TaxID=904190 RepID=UPI00374EA590
MKKSNKRMNIFSLILMIIASVYTIFPIYVAFLNSFKTQGEMYQSVLAWPQQFTLDNYIDAFIRIEFVKSFLNTLVVTGAGVFGIVAVSSLAGYKLSRTKTKLSNALYLFFIFSMLVPFSAVMISITREITAMGLSGTKTGLILTYIGFGCSQAIFLYHGFVKGVPRDLDEAAMIDGCGQFRTFTQVIFPCLKPITATITILNVLWLWNDFLLPLVLISKQKNYTLVLSTNMFFGKYNNEWSNIMAGLILTVIPVIIFYAIFQKHIMEGIVSGAIKG